jgi:hypothetical protein
MCKKVNYVSEIVLEANEMHITMEFFGLFAKETAGFLVC